MESFDELLSVVRRLRAECPWDSVQTHENMIECLKNETAEVIESVSRYREMGDSDNLCEELGDVLFILLLHSVIAEEDGLFSVEDVLKGIVHKMTFRHPRIFAPEDEELNALSWSELKRREKELRKTIKAGEAQQ